MLKVFPLILLLLAAPGKPGRQHPLGEDVSYGLTFQSTGFHQDERTSMVLNPGRPVSGKNGFSVAFDFRVFPVDCFGNIFRFYDNRLNHFDFTSNHDASRFSFIFGNANGILSSIAFEPGPGAWNHLEININQDEDQVTVNLNGQVAEVPLQQTKLGHFTLAFGSVESGPYISHDLPRFSLRNVRLTDARGQRSYSWPLDRHSEIAAYDTLHGRPALVRNGIWEIDSHVNWEEAERFRLSVNNPQIAYSLSGDRLFLAWRDSVLTYHTLSGDQEGLRAEHGQPYSSFGSTMIHDGESDVLVSYYPATAGINRFHFDTRSWEAEGPVDIYHSLHQHGRYFDAETGTLFLFGGYGMYKFSNTLFIAHPRTGSWTQTSLPVIARCFCAMGRYKDKILIAGGMGSKSGRQEGDSQNLYDILALDPETLEITPFCDIQRVSSEPFVFCPTALVDEEEGAFYSLVFNDKRFNSQARLCRIGLNDGQMIFFSEPLPFEFVDIRSTCEVFRCRKTAKLYAAIASATEEQVSEIALYSLSYPPLQRADVFVKDPPRYRGAGLLLVGLLLAGAAGVLLVRRKYRRQPAEEPSFQIQPFQAQRSFIGLLGSFKVLDRNGQDITRQFSPMLRNILSFIILEGMDSDGAVSRTRMDELFWPDMERRNAVNNRRVNLSKLRSLLMLLGGKIDLITEEEVIRLVWDEAVVCDYKLLHEKLAQLNGKGKKTPEAIREALQIAARGPLLRDLDGDWADSYKSGLIWSLGHLLQMNGTGKGRESQILQIQIADAVLAGDPIDEDAVAARCRALYKLGHKGMAKETYDRFCAAFRGLLDAEPSLSWREITLS